MFLYQADLHCRECRQDDVQGTRIETEGLEGYIVLLSDKNCNFLGLVGMIDIIIVFLLLFLMKRKSAYISIEIHVCSDNC